MGGFPRRKARHDRVVGYAGGANVLYRKHTMNDEEHEALTLIGAKKFMIFFQKWISASEGPFVQHNTNAECFS